MAGRGAGSGALPLEASKNAKILQRKVLTSFTIDTTYSGSSAESPKEWRCLESLKNSGEEVISLMPAKKKAAKKKR